ncbi:MAG TPA: sugar transferase [Myxococcales bacterium]|nr:sugar transferase [Myxococcales bacterium]
MSLSSGRDPRLPKRGEPIVVTSSAGGLAYKAVTAAAPALDARAPLPSAPSQAANEPPVREPEPLPSKSGSLLPGISAQLNLFADVFALVGSLYLGTQGTGRAWAYFTPAAVALWLIGTAALQHYEPFAYRRDKSDDGAMVCVLVVGILSLLVMARLVGDTARLPRDLAFFALFLPAILGMRLFLFRPLSERERPCDEVLVVGTGAMGRATGKDLVRRSRQRPVGYLVFADEARNLVLREPILGTCCDLENILRTRPISEVYIAGNALRNGEHMQHAVTVCEALGTPFALPAYSLRLERAVPNAGHGATDGYIHFGFSDDKQHQLGLKRLFDIAVSATALWLLTPLFVAVAVLIKLTSCGPVFFRQTRTGMQGREFNILKFRTMVVGADALKSKLAARNEQTGPVFKMRNDPRVTPFGRFLRKYSIDELPQLINVIRGDMSLVGPRPPLPAEVMKYAPWQRRRLSVRPGLTCIWQVSGRSGISFEQWMYMDIQYIDHWSLLRDIQLIFQTVPAVLTGRGAS